MSEALTRWKSRRRGIVVLPSGTEVGIELVSVAVEILAGTFPAQVVGLARAMESNTADLEHELSDDELTQARRYRHIVISRMVKSADGEEVTLSEEDVAELPEGDQEMLWAYHLRLLPLRPKDEDEEEGEEESNPTS